MDRPLRDVKLPARFRDGEESPPLTLKKPAARNAPINKAGTIQCKTLQRPRPPPDPSTTPSSSPGFPPPSRFRQPTPHEVLTEKTTNGKRTILDDHKLKDEQKGLVEDKKGYTYATLDPGTWEDALMEVEGFRRGREARGEAEEPRVYLKALGKFPYERKEARQGDEGQRKK